MTLALSPTETRMRRILVANRGEIALRIMRTCRRLGIEAVAVYSESDAGSAHVQAADVAVPIGPGAPRSSYLSAEKLVEAARLTRADAVHPGYGFLSESPSFAQKVVDAGLVWIGPRPETIAAMGDKGRARDVAVTAGVPVLPASRPFAEITSAIGDAAEAIGYPLLVKAAAGGGGIGMRRVDSAGQLLEAARATHEMARRAFGNSAIYLERLVEHGRHVEIQVFGFGDGHAIHFYERDCSLQRRFQKVIEESPAPALPEALRRRMAEAALSLARQERYAGAGTVEFIVDANQRGFFFLEMNTRIQVEHPVTEMCVGVDLVAMQIDLARGSPLRREQSEIQLCGAALECRLYAENPDRGFVPSPGTLNVWRMPAESESLRVETGYRQGDQVSIHYDPLLAKIICHGADRPTAIARARRALADARVEGITTNLPFLIRILDHRAFVEGHVFTGFIDAHRGELTGC